ncbi:hypothetical protein DUNSADRAFT_4917 [Dunaliella salina]|uniref:Encoded protein n=1 Tax=Dunaliella salina TaxID=3046 RepID=A0ABQ7GR04_DUNSA|nr:hypothetical protein DUNSADRAFT_4917 [Dunaliella salina]|eukprot:KAF5837037.1 hypothetical protein DUNSADRAFT_4917 [Dunaliella salina]
MSEGEPQPKGPLFNLLFSDIIVGRVVQHKQDHREGVIRFPVYQDYTNNYAATYAVRFADSATHDLEEVPADKLSISDSFAEDNAIVPASVLELQRHNWYQPRFTTNGLENLLGMSPAPPASAANAAQQQPQPPTQPMPSPPSEVGVGTAQAAGLLRNLRTGAASRKQGTRAPSAAAPSAAAEKQPAQKARRALFQAKEQLPQAAPPGPPAPAAPASKQQVASEHRAPQPAPVQDSPGLQFGSGEQPGLQPEQRAAGGEGHRGGARKRRAR